MDRKKEPCRNFQRGSCQYGERCKFLHVTQQQPKPNSFGFGQTGSQFQHTNQQQQQQKPNPFGFGVQNSSQPKGPSDSGPKHQNQFKPFENKWNRFSSLAPANSSPSPQADTQPQVANHKCTDPESCKRQIVEDFEHERPLWKLTCYGHWKYRPCDIVGDISYEELQAAAYNDAKQGLSLLSIVERERNLLNTKLIEFENLLHNPYVISPNIIPAGPSPFPGTNLSASAITVSKNVPPSVSSFSQLGTSINQGFSTSPPAPSNSTFGQLSQLSSQTSGGPGMNILTFGTQGSLGGQQLMQSFGSVSTSSISTFNDGVMSAGNNPFSHSSAASLQFPGFASNQTSIFANRPNAAANMVGQASGDNRKTEGVPMDMSIWLKAEWCPGEIPEEAPPDGYV